MLLVQEEYVVQIFRAGRAAGRAGQAGWAFRLGHIHVERMYLLYASWPLPRDGGREEARVVGTSHAIRSESHHLTVVDLLAKDTEQTVVDEWLGGDGGTDRMTITMTE